jgi:pimeloyl-ACP methyl ester carboxylesterase
MKHAHIAANGLTLHVVEHGEGPVVIFCHGFPDTWRGWRRQMEAVAAAGFRAVALDMRGYGESSAPEDPLAYTVLHTVGDVIGVLDAFDLRSATIVGHDFGAAVAWNAALMRPDRFHAVFGLSVPFQPRGDKSYLQTLSDAGRTDFYMFHRMRPEADVEWADASVSYPANLYWSSAAPPAEDRWTLFNRDKPMYRRPPASLPDWADPEVVAATIADFQRTGFHGALNYYRSIQHGFDLLAPFKGKLVEQPSFLVMGEADGLGVFGGSATIDELRRSLPGIIGHLRLPGVGHWPQQEAAEAVNVALIDFLRRTN